MAPALLTPELLLKAEQDTICLYEVYYMNPFIKQMSFSVFENDKDK